MVEIYFFIDLLFFNSGKSCDEVEILSDKLFDTELEDVNMLFQHGFLGIRTILHLEEIMKVFTEFLIFLLQLEHSHVHHFIDIVTCLIWTCDVFDLVELASLLLVQPPHAL